MWHGGVSEVERDRASLVGIPTHKCALDAVGVRGLGDVVGIRRKGGSVLDTDNLVVVAGHIVIREVIGLKGVGNVDGRFVRPVAIVHVRLVLPERRRCRIALNLAGGNLVQIVTGVLLVHRQRAIARCHRVDKRKRAVGLLVVVVDCAAALLARTIEVAYGYNAVRGHVVLVVGISGSLKVVAREENATRTVSPIVAEKVTVRRVPVVVIRPLTILERSTVLAGEILDELDTAPFDLVVLHRAQHAIVVNVHDGGTVAGDGDAGLGVVGVEGKAGVVLVVGTGHDGTGRRRLLGRLNEVVRLGGGVGVFVVSHALLPIVDGVGDLDGRPMSGKGHRRVKCSTVDDLGVVQIPTLERVPSAGAHGQHDSLTRVHEHMVDGGAASGVEGNPYTRHNDGKHVDMIRALRHCHGSQPVAVRVSPAHNAVLGINIVLDARNVVGLMVLNDHRAHELHAVGVVEVDVQDGGIPRVHVVRCGRAHTHGLREVYGVLAQIPTGERLARNLGSPGFDKHLAVLDDLLADNGVVGVMEPVGCQVDGVLIGNDVDREVVDVETLDVGAGLTCRDCLNAGGVVGHAVHAHGLALTHAGVEEAHAHGAVGLNSVAVLVNERDVKSHGAFERATLLLDGTSHGGGDVGAMHRLSQHARAFRQRALGGRHLHGDVAGVGIAEKSGIRRLLGLGSRGRLCCRLLGGSGLDCGLLGRCRCGRLGGGCGLLSGSGLDCGLLSGCGLLGRRGLLSGCGLLGRRGLLSRRGLDGGLLDRSRLDRRLLSCRFDGSRGLLDGSRLSRRLDNRGRLGCRLLGRRGLYRGLSNNLRRTCSLYLGYRFGCRRADDILLFALRGTHCGAVRSRLAPVALRQGRGHHRHLGPHHDQRHENSEYLAYVLGRVE